MAKILTTQLKPFIGFEKFLEIVPVGFVHVVEDVEIDGDGFGRVLGEEGFDGGVELRVVHGFWEILHDAFFVRNAESVEKFGDDAELLFKEPSADEIAGDEIEGRACERAQHLGVAFGAGLAFEKDGPELAGFGDGFHGSVVEGFVGFIGVGDDFHREWGRHEAEKFVRGEHRVEKVKSVN